MANKKMEEVKKLDPQSQKQIEGLRLILEGYCMFYDWDISEIIEELKVMAQANKKHEEAVELMDKTKSK